MTAIDVWIDRDGVARPMGHLDAAARAGRLVRTEFIYDRSYLGTPDALALDPSTPLDSAAHVRAALPRGLADAGPDGWGRRLITRSQAGPLSDADLLLHVDDFARMGALRLTIPESAGAFVSEEHDVPRLLALPELLQAAQEFEAEPGDLTAIRRLLDAGSGGLGGARPKASILDDDRLLIAKFPSTNDEIDVLAWEKLCLDIAEQAGIPVPERRLVAVGGARVLLLARFDRDRAVRIPYLSAYAIGTAPDPASGDYLEIAADASEMDLADLGATSRDLLRRAALNVALRNTDDHLQNHGFLWSRAGWRLSPAFDITPNHVDGTTRATSIDGETHPAREARALLELGRALRLTHVESTRIISEVLDAAALWRDRAVALTIDDTEIRLLAPVLDGAQARIRTVLDL